MSIPSATDKNNIDLPGIFLRAAQAWLVYPALTTLAILSLFVQQAFSTYFSYSLKLIIDNVLNHTNQPSLGYILAGLSVAFIIMALASFGGEYINARASANIFNDMRRRLHTQLQRLSASFYSQAQMGDVLARFSGDLKALESGYLQGFLNVILITLGLLINIPYMLYLDWRLTLLVLMLIPLLLLVVRGQLPHSMAAGLDLRGREAETVNLVQETIRAHQVIKTFALEKLMSQRFEQKLLLLKGDTIRARVRMTSISKIASLGVMLIQLCVVLVGARLAFDGQISIGAFISFTAILSVVMKDIYEFSKKVVPSLVEAAGGIQRIEELLAEPITVKDAPAATRLTHVEGAIKFDNILFSYLPGHPNLRRVSFEIAAGKSVVFVGSSGSGKSTILSLIMRFYDPQQGQVLIDGINIHQISQESLRAHMSAVFQDNYLFNTSIRENIRLGRPTATDEEVEMAARAAEIHEAIQHLPTGYETIVGEAGGRLSGGQRQRIAIARALLSDPRILLLDEATSALDPATEDAVNKTLAQIGKGRTVISVSHRLRAARTADLIFVMQNGALVEQGTHVQLLAQKGVYAELWNKQSGFEISRDGRHARVGAERLRSVALFANLSREVLQELTRQFRSEYYEAGQMVIAQGEEGEKFYLIVRGEVKVTVKDRAGNEHLINFLDDGDYFGELALLTNQLRTATVETTTPCLFLTMPRSDLIALSANHPDVAAVLEAHMESRLKRSQALDDISRVALD